MATIATETRDGAALAKRVGRRTVLYTVATFFTLFAALPFAWMVFTVFKQNTDLYNGKPPKIWAGCSGPRMLDIAGRYVDGWWPSGVWSPECGGLER